MRATSLAAGGLACAGAALTIAALAGGAPHDPPPAARGPAHRGLDVWLEQGCGSCHTFEPAHANGEIGPDLQQTLRSRSRDYVRESIVLPDARIAAGYGGSTMPEDYAQRIAPQDLEPLVDFLLQGQQAGA